MYGGEYTPVVYVWETNDPVNPWYAEARCRYPPMHVLPCWISFHILVLKGDDAIAKFPQASAPNRQLAKELAAYAGYQWLLAQYPHIDLINV